VEAEHLSDAEQGDQERDIPAFASAYVRGSSLALLVELKVQEQRFLRYELLALNLCSNQTIALVLPYRVVVHILVHTTSSISHRTKHQKVGLNLTYRRFIVWRGTRNPSTLLVSSVSVIIASGLLCYFIGRVILIPGIVAVLLRMRLRRSGLRAMNNVCRWVWWMEMGLGRRYRDLPWSRRTVGHRMCRNWLHSRRSINLKLVCMKSGIDRGHGCLYGMWMDGLSLTIGGGCMNFCTSWSFVNTEKSN